MTEHANKEIIAHKKNFQSVCWAIELGGKFEMLIDSAHAESVIWAKNQIGQLELENENLSNAVLSLSKSLPMPSPEADEETYHRRRRDQMLDEVTLICVRNGIEQMEKDETEEQNWGHLARDWPLSPSLDRAISTEEQNWGHLARDIAEKICRGIDEFDAE